MEEFIREKIKDKPLNKKKTAQKIAVAALCGIAFGVCASLVFLIAGHFMTDKKGESVVSQSSEITNSQDMNVDPEDSGDEEDTQTTSVDGDADVQAAVGTQDYVLTLEDYQAVQNELYKIGSSANKFVVSVTGVTDAEDIFNNKYETEGQGVGVIVADSGKQLLILTEKSVVDGADKLRVTFVNDTVADAVAVKYDSNTGMAIVSVDKTLLDDSTVSAIAVATIGNSNIVSRGTTVIALEANYAILTGTVTSTSNEVSAQDNNYAVLTTNIASNKSQTGILINTTGEVIGLVLPGFSSAEESNTLAAVGSSDLSAVIEKLQNAESVPYIGITGTTVTDKISNRYSIPKGVYIKEVTMDSPAFAAGLQSGDVITEFDGADVTTIAAYSTRLMQKKQDDVCTIKFKRKGGNGYTEMTAQVKIGVME